MISSRSLLIAALLTPLANLVAAERIVTLGAPVTETVFALGAGDEVVARDASSMYPRAAAALPDVGYFRTISAEGVLSKNPTVIVADFGTGPSQQVELLKNSGAKFVYLQAKPSAENTIAMIEQVGAAVGRTKEADALADKLRSQLTEATALAKASGRTPKVIFVMGVSGSSLQAAGDNTAATGLIQMAGAVNPLSGFNGYKSISPETLLELDPDFILYAKKLHGGGTALSLETAPPWMAASRAMRTGRVQGIDMTYHLVFGPRLGEAVLDVTKMLHAH
ncbi:MAG: ABC transporter substrate-binding protein [Rariglobus sp.]